MVNDAFKTLNPPVIQPVSSNPFSIQIEEEHFLAMYHGKATDTLARMNSKGEKANPITGSLEIQNGELKLVLKKFTDLRASLGVNTHKLLSVGIAKFTALNNYSRAEQTSLQYMVQIPLEWYATKSGYDITPHYVADPEEAEKEKKRASNALKDAKKKIKKDLDLLASMELTWNEKVKGQAGDYTALHIIGTRGIRNGYIFMTFDPSFAKYLSKLPLSQYSENLLGVDARSSNAYSMGLKFCEHYNLDNNLIIGTATRLKVETLLKYTSLPSFDKVYKANKDWEERIKEPFEKSLDELTRSKVLEDWSYRGAKGIELADTEATNLKYEDWKELFIEFKLVHAPDHKERLEKRAEEKEARAKKKTTKNKKN